MGRYITGLFSARGKQAQAPASSLRIQTSVFGQPIPLILGGQMRMPANLIWYGGFQAVGGSSPGGGGGKGGIFGTQGAGSGGQQPNYYANVMFGLCEGPITTIAGVWLGGAEVGIAQWGAANSSTAISVDIEVFVGTPTQTAWGFLAARFPLQALPYRRIAYVGSANWPCGNDPTLQQIQWEVRSTNSYVNPDIPDGLASVALTSFLTDANYGLGFPSNRLGTLAVWANYCLATGLLVSPTITTQIAASSFVNDLLAATNSNARWSSGVLDVVPYGDQPITVGEIQQATEARTIPLTTINTVAGWIVPSEGATFVSDIQVFNTSTGLVFTRVPLGARIGVNQYSVNPHAIFGLPIAYTGAAYLFNSSQIGTGVTIVYDWAATASYQPNTQPIYDLTIDDFMPNQGSIGSGLAVKNSPLIVVRKSRDQMNNIVRVEYLDRTYLYNPVVAQVKNDAYITLYRRERPADLKQFHFFCVGSAAQYSAAMLMVRENIARTYQWTCGHQFILLDVMDVVTVSDPNQGIFRQPVRITEIQENADRSLTMTAEEFPGTAQAPLYGREAAQGYGGQANADPGPLNTPLFFEPTAEALGGASLEIWVALSGGANWGGCQVWASSDGGATYRQLPGKLAAPARMGVTTSDLPVFAANPTGQTIDQSNTFGVDLTESGGVLSAAATADAQALRTACYIGNGGSDGEIIAYANAVLTGTNKYNLSYLVRGAFGTEANIVDHPAGTPFVRLDRGIYEVPFAISDIGQTIFLKFPSFNTSGGGQQSLADVPAYPYVIQGAALKSPLPDVSNLVSTFVDGRLAVSWDEVASKDFRTGIIYEIRAGLTFIGSVQLGLLAHPPFVLPAGTNTYWVRAVCQPIPGLFVFSETPAEIAVSNAQVTSNFLLLGAYDFQALSWPGTLGGGAFVDVGLNAVRTGPSSGPQVNGLYTPGNSYVIDCGYDVATPVYLTTSATGIPLGQDILTIADILTDPDILGAASAGFVDVYPEIAFGNTNPPTNWQKFVPGSYTGRYKQVRWQITTIDPKSIGYLLGATFTLGVPIRIDHPLTNGTLSSGGLAITFQPDAAGSPAPFHGGPNGATNPAVSVEWSGSDAAQGDYAKVTSLSTSGCTVQIFDATNTAVTRHQVTIIVTGF